MLDRSRDLERIALIEALNVMDPALGRSLDPVTELAAFTFGTAIALISIVDADSQRFISRVGLALERTDRHHSICSCAAVQRDPADRRPAPDPRFHDNPLVAGPEQMRFYAGAPLVTRNGIALGTLCLMDRTHAC